MKKNILYGIFGAIFLLVESIVASAMSTVIDIDKPSTYVNLFKLPIFWMTVVIIVVVQIIVAFREKKKDTSICDSTLKTKAGRKQSIEITKTECITRLMESATEKAIKGNFYDAKETMEILKNLNDILESGGNKDGKNKEQNNC